MDRPQAGAVEHLRESRADGWCRQPKLFCSHAVAQSHPVHQTACCGRKGGAALAAAAAEHAPAPAQLQRTQQQLSPAAGLLQSSRLPPLPGQHEQQAAPSDAAAAAAQRGSAVQQQQAAVQSRSDMAYDSVACAPAVHACATMLFCMQERVLGWAVRCVVFKVPRNIKQHQGGQCRVVLQHRAPCFCLMFWGTLTTMWAVPSSWCCCGWLVPDE